MNHALKSEWIKLTTIRSLAWSLGLYLWLMLGLSVAYGTVPGERDLNAKGFDPIGLGLSLVPLGMILLMVVGVLAVTGEYASGTIRSSLLAVPDRTRFYVAKLGLLALVTGALSTAGIVAGFFIVQAFIGDHAAPFDAATVGHLAGAVLYTVLLVLFSMGLATVLRSSAATLTTLIPLFFMVSTMLNHIPRVSAVAQFLPDVAGGLALQQHSGGGVLNAWSGLGVLAVWAIVSILAGHMSLTRRDA
ncbi:ABC transporter permease [Streptomyces sp. NBC_01431]|uniref:ABC transporter permease n=1 Tax=Streptomyces sp. NBC_01431 TaxID=2903863 RepID=UPI002E331947|nr:ABC transporter permease [Streptomyces sp. NBC_01431]